MSQQVYFGIDGLQFLSDNIKGIAPKDIFLVTGGASFDRCGASDIINERLGSYNLHRFSEFDVNPKWEDVQRGLQMMNKINPQAIVAVGGGSVLDMAKLIRFFHSYQGDPTGKSFEKKSELIPLYAMPTTSGTGSEATHFAVLYVDGVKYSVAHEDILPNYALIYPPFTYDNSKYLTACTGFDALAQSIEAYWSVNATEESDEYALKGLQLIWNNIEDVVNNPTPQKRDLVAEGAYWAGRAINIAKTTAPHAFSYQFTSKCGYPHGHAVALTFPFFFDLNLNDTHYRESVNVDLYQQKIERLRQLMSISKGNEKTAILKKMEAIHLAPFENKDHYNVQILLSAVNIQRLNNNPVIVDDKIMKSLLNYL